MEREVAKLQKQRRGDRARGAPDEIERLLRRGAAALVLRGAVARASELSLCAALGRWRWLVAAAAAVPGAAGEPRARHGGSAAPRAEPSGWYRGLKPPGLR